MKVSSSNTIMVSLSWLMLAAVLRTVRSDCSDGYYAGICEPSCAAVGSSPITDFYETCPNSPCCVTSCTDSIFDGFCTPSSLLHMVRLN
jgi:hypothetical protein